MDLGLSGRSVLVTGASRGIGRAIAEGFAAEGCRIVLTARAGTSLEAAREEIAACHKADVAAHAADLGQPGSAQRLFASYPDTDILVNNAGAIPTGDLAGVDEAAWRAAWDLKVFGFINLTREYYAAMQRRRSGVIINVIGLAAERLDYDYIAGSAANAGLVAFTRALGSASLDWGVRVVGVNPGWVETEKTQRSFRRRAERELGDPDRWRELIATSWPGGRLIPPRDVANLVVFLGSERAASISGHIMTIDAGVGARSFLKPAASAAPR